MDTRAILGTCTTIQKLGDGVNSSLVDELQEFVHAHRVHGALTADVTEPDWNGYLLTVACQCGVVFERWIMLGDAELDLLRIARLN